MRLITYLDELNWTQTRLVKESGISATTIQRIIKGEATLQRKNAEILCATLTRALHRDIHPQDVDEIQTAKAERPERRKPKDQHGD